MCARFLGCGVASAVARCCGCWRCQDVTDTQIIVVTFPGQDVCHRVHCPSLSLSLSLSSFSLSLSLSLSSLCVLLDGNGSLDVLVSDFF